MKERKRKSLKKRLRNLLNGLVNPLGLEVISRRPIPWQAVLRQERPATIIDVGAGGGTPDLSQHFPDAYYVLVEPLEEYGEVLERFLRHHKGQWIKKAAGREKTIAAIQVDSLYLGKSSFMERDALTKSAHAVTTREVVVERLDTMLADINLPSPICVKIDAEGMEHWVLEGAQQTISRAAFVIIEVSVMKRFKDSYKFEDILKIMNGYGFYLSEVLDPPFGVGGVKLLDLLFTPNNPV